MRKKASTDLIHSLRKTARDLIKVAEDLSHIELELGKDKAGSDNDHNADWEHVEQRLDQPNENMYDYARMRQPAFEDDSDDELPASYKEANSASNRPQSLKSAKFNGLTRKSSVEAVKAKQANTLVRKTSLDLIKEARNKQA